MPITYTDRKVKIYTSGPVGDNIIVASPGRIHIKIINVINDTTAKRWVFLYDQATIPTPSDQPFMRKYLANKSELEVINLIDGLVFQEGFAAAISKNADVLNQDNGTKFYWTVAFVDADPAGIPIVITVP